MSEYQYYEFLAIDKPLSQKQLEQVRGYSSRARITSTSFVNEYHWGDFRGNVHDFLKRFFDMFVYLANWGTHDFAFRVPARLVDKKAAEAYATEECLAVKSTGEHVLFYFSSQSEDYDDMVDCSCLMASLAPLREQVMSGDHRPLYLAWLAAVRERDSENDTVEPPVPPGLRELSAAQRTLAEYLRVDEDLLEAAAETSPDRKVSQAGLAEWIAGLPESEKNRILAAICDGSDPSAAVGLRCRFNAARAAACGSAPGRPARTVGDLLTAARRITQKREEREARRKAAEKARLEADAAKVREKHLAELAESEPAAWRKVDTLIAMKTPKRYDEAAALLRDLADVARRAGTEPRFGERITAIRTRYANRPALLDRLSRVR